MKSKLTTALVTTLYQLPVVFWLYLGICIYRTGGVNLSEPSNLVIGFTMVAILFLVAYTTQRINKYVAVIYWLVPLSIGVMMIFEKSWVAQIILFLSFIILMIYPFKSKQKEQVNNFEDLLKRGNLPDDDRVVPNWLKIKNRQFDDIDFTNNNVDEIIKLTSDEFNEFISSTPKSLIFAYLSTLNDVELEKFYKYNDEIVKFEDGTNLTSREQFEGSMLILDIESITDEQKQRATLEIPLIINFAKYIYHKIIAFSEFIEKDYFNYNHDDYRKYEGHLVKIIWDRMDNIPFHFEQVLDHFKDFYDESNNEHKLFAQYLAKRFGYLITTLNILVQMTQDRKDTSLNWFMDNFMLDEKRLDGFELYKNDRLVFNLMNTYMGICEQSDDSYLSSLISTVETLFEYYPVNREACEYTMVEMMKSVAVKKVNVENANRFIAFFEELPRFYEVLSYDKIYELKELIGHTLSNYKPQDNEIFDEDGVKNKMILLNYLIDMEDLYYKSGKDEKWSNI